MNKKINNYMQNEDLNEFLKDNFKTPEILNIKDLNSFQTGLREIREKNSLEQKDIAYKTGLKQSAISRIESGDSNPTLDTILKLLDAYDYTLAIMPKE